MPCGANFATSGGAHAASPQRSVGARCAVRKQYVDARIVDVVVHEASGGFALRHLTHEEAGADRCKIFGVLKAAVGRDAVCGVAAEHRRCRAAARDETKVEQSASSERIMPLVGGASSGPRITAPRITEKRSMLRVFIAFAQPERDPAANPGGERRHSVHDTRLIAPYSDGVDRRLIEYCGGADSITRGATTPPSALTSYSTRTHPSMRLLRASVGTQGRRRTRRRAAGSRSGACGEDRETKSSGLARTQRLCPFFNTKNCRSGTFAISGSMPSRRCVRRPGRIAGYTPCVRRLSGWVRCDAASGSKTPRSIPPRARPAPRLRRRRGSGNPTGVVQCVERAERCKPGTSHGQPLSIVASVNATQQVRYCCGSTYV